MSDAKNFRVILWCVPRSISTAIAKCCTFVDNTQVWMEPYCLAFFQDFMLKSMGFPLPRKMEDFNADQFNAMMSQMIKGTPMENMFAPDKVDMSLFIRDGVRKELESASKDKSMFIKDMAYGITNNLDLLPSRDSGYRHTFLIRDPERMFPSWRVLVMKQLAQMPMPGSKPVDSATFDITTDVPYMPEGYTYKCQYDLWKHVKDSNLDSAPVVIDIDEMLANPAEMLPKYFAACGMPWDDKYLHWDASPEKTKTWRCIFPMTGSPADDVVAVTHMTALQSSEFLASKPKIPRSEMTPDTIKAVDATMEYYTEMFNARIKL